MLPMPAFSAQNNQAPFQKCGFSRILKTSKERKKKNIVKHKRVKTAECFFVCFFFLQS